MKQGSTLVMQKEKIGPREHILPSNFGADPERNELTSELLRELVAHLSQNRTQLREEWVARIAEARLLTGMTQEEIFGAAASVYDTCVEPLATAPFYAQQAECT